MKTCSRCSNNFEPKSSNSKYCSDECRRLVVNERSKAYNKKHAERIKAKLAEYYNSDKAREINRKSYHKHKNDPKKKADQKRYYKKNRAKISKYRKDYYNQK